MELLLKIVFGIIIWLVSVFTISLGVEIGLKSYSKSIRGDNENEIQK